MAILYKKTLMKKFWMVWVLAVGMIPAVAQDFNRLADLEPKTAEECKAAEPDVLSVATYVLTRPVVAMSDEYRTSMRLIIAWMSNTPAYKFSIDATIAKLAKDNEELFGLYMASMTKTVLENPAIASDAESWKLASYKTLLDFCAQPANNIKMTKHLSKAIKANQEGKLREYLK